MNDCIASLLHGSSAAVNQISLLLEKELEESLRYKDELRGLWHEDSDPIVVRKEDESCHLLGRMVTSRVLLAQNYSLIP